jgi:hypothetical protein
MEKKNNFEPPGHQGTKKKVLRPLCGLEKILGVFVPWWFGFSFSPSSPCLRGE